MQAFEDKPLDTFLSDREKFEKEWLHWSPPRDVHGYYVSDLVEAKYSMWSAFQLKIRNYEKRIMELENALSKA